MSDLTPDILLQAYRAGFFPMAASRDAAALDWYAPDPRALLPIDGLHVPRRLQRTVLKNPYRITVDADFEGVMRACAAARADTWINAEIIALYTALHRQGFAHSVEAWRGEEMVGGIYGVSIGAAFFGESMFSTATDASKITLVHLAARLKRQGYKLFDVQFVNDHLKQFGVYEMSRAKYGKLLAEAVGSEVRFYSSPSSSSSSSSSSSAAGAAGFCAGLPSGTASVENTCDLADVASFLQSITQTS